MKAFPWSLRCHGASQTLSIIGKVLSHVTVMARPQYSAEPWVFCDKPVLHVSAASSSIAVGNVPNK
jgi:hypothetical protein